MRNRHIRLSDIKPNGKCLECRKPLISPARKYCTEKCRVEYYSKNYSHTFREKKLQKAGKCQVCGEQKDLQLHHILPISKGGELLADGNIVILCKNCHKLEHANKNLTSPKAKERMF